MPCAWTSECNATNTPHLPPYLTHLTPLHSPRGDWKNNCLLKASPGCCSCSQMLLLLCSCAVLVLLYPFIYQTDYLSLSVYPPIHPSVCPPPTAHQPICNGQVSLPPNTFLATSIRRVNHLQAASCLTARFWSRAPSPDPLPPPPLQKEHWRKHRDSRLAKTRTVCGLADEQWLELSMAGTSSSADRPFDARFRKSSIDNRAAAGVNQTPYSEKRHF